MPSFMTAVEQRYLENQCNHRVLHGRPESEEIISSSSGATYKKLLFLPNNIVFYERWTRNNFGTTLWEIFAFKTSEPLREIQSIPGVHPGAELYLHVSGKDKAKKALAFLDQLSTQSLDPCGLSEAHIRALNIRIQTGCDLSAILKKIELSFNLRR